MPAPRSASCTGLGAASVAIVNSTIGERPPIFNRITVGGSIQCRSRVGSYLYTSTVNVVTVGRQFRLSNVVQCRHSSRNVRSDGGQRRPLRFLPLPLCRAWPPLPLPPGGVSTAAGHVPPPPPLPLPPRAMAISTKTSGSMESSCVCRREHKASRPASSRRRSSSRSSLACADARSSDASSPRAASCASSLEMRCS